MAVVLTVAALRVSEPVTLPLVLALFLLAMTRPLYCPVERRAPSWVVAFAVTLAVLLGLAVIAGAFALSIQQVAGRGSELMRRVQTLAEQLRQWTAVRGLPAPSGRALSRVGSALGTLFGAGTAALQFLGLTLAYFVLGLVEVSTFRDKVRRGLRPPAGGALVEAAADIAARVRRYLGPLTVTCVIAGTAAGLFAWAVGRDGALTWALVTFLLNYIPMIGPFASVVPPTLFAVVQGDSAGHVGLIFVGLGAIRFVIGNFLDPKIAGRALSLSPLVVLVAITFWGLVWGVVGALLAVPLTVALVAVCKRFERTRWIAVLLGGR